MSNNIAVYDIAGKDVLQSVQNTKTFKIFWSGLDHYLALLTSDPYQRLKAQNYDFYTSILAKSIFS